MGATLAGRAVAGGRRFDEHFARCSLTHLVKDAVVGRNDEFLCVQRDCCRNQLRGRTDHVGLLDHRSGGLRMLVQVLHDIETDRRGHHPVRACLHSRAGICIHDHGAIRMRVAECGEFISRTAEVERARRVEIGHQNGLLRRKNFCGLAHEAYAGHHQCLRCMVAAKARHLQ